MGKSRRQIINKRPDSVMETSVAFGCCHLCIGVVVVEGEAGAKRKFFYNCNLDMLTAITIIPKLAYPKDYCIEE